MDYWFLENLEKLVPIIIALLYFLGMSRAKKREGQEEGPDPQAEERARKIQEEIRRKILERQQRGKAAPKRETSPEPTVNVPEQPLHPGTAKSAREVAEVEVFPSSPQEPVEASPIEFSDPFEEERRRIEEQLKNCTIYAPQGGMVVYANERSGRFGQSSAAVEDRQAAG